MVAQINNTFENAYFVTKLSPVPPAPKGVEVMDSSFHPSDPIQVNWTGEGLVDIIGTVFLSRSLTEEEARDFKLIKVLYETGGRYEGKRCICNPS
jgi:hypothetical protein